LPISNGSCGAGTNCKKRATLLIKKTPVSVIELITRHRCQTKEVQVEIDIFFACSGVATDARVCPPEVDVPALKVTGAAGISLTCLCTKEVQVTLVHLVVKTDAIKGSSLLVPVQIADHDRIAVIHHHAPELDVESRGAQGGIAFVNTEI